MATEKSAELLAALRKNGYEEELCQAITYKYMNTDFTAKRMLGYLRSMPNPRIEDVIDEMLAILSERERFIAKHESEYAQSKINEVYMCGFEDYEGVYGDDYSI